MNDTKMTDFQRRYMACLTAIYHWNNCGMGSIGKAIQESFEDEDMTATELEIILGIDSVRYWKMSTGETTPEQVASNCAALSIAEGVSK